MPHLVLASESPARLKTLRGAGVEPDVVVSGVDEDAVLAAAVGEHGRLTPAEVALHLACAKAEAVAERVTAGNGDSRGPLVLGCDSVLELDGETYGKPADDVEAAKRWRAMRGTSGVLHTGHWLIDAQSDPPRALGGTGSTTVHFADMSDDEVDAYVATGEPLNVAGAFKIDGLGGPFVERIEGDHHNIVGLSLPLLRNLLAEFDVPWHTLWKS